MADRTAIAGTPFPIGTPGLPRGAFGPAYEAYAIARLEGTAFEIRPLQTEHQSLDQDRITWDWNVLPQKSGPQIVNALIIVQWRPTDSEGDPIERDIWREHLTIQVTEPWIKRDQLNILSLASGLLGSALSAPWIYDRIKEIRKKRQEEEQK